MFSIIVIEKIVTEIPSHLFENSPCCENFPKEKVPIQDLLSHSIF